MPDYPLMPGVLMCEAAAQLCSFFCGYSPALKKGFIGFGGMEDVRFRGQVRPGDRLVLVSKADAAASPADDVRHVRGSSATTWSFMAKIIGVPFTAGRSRTELKPPRSDRRESEAHRALDPVNHMRTMSRSRPAIDVSHHLIDPGGISDEPSPIDWAAFFGNDNPVELEIGSGKGLFLVNAATATRP